MIYFHKELKMIYKYDYNIQKEVKKNNLYKIDKGLYSDKEFVNPLEVILKKYPNAIFTDESAFYYHDLTDVVPNYYYLATSRTYSRINDNGIKQIFIQNELLNIGIDKITIDNIEINIYNKERMLVELIRKRNKIPFDYYKEIINNYRNIIDDLDIYKISEYISYYRNEKTLYDVLQREVF